MNTDFRVLGLHTGPQLPLLCKFWEGHCNEVNFYVSSTKPSASIQKNCNLKYSNVFNDQNQISYHFAAKWYPLSLY